MKPTSSMVRKFSGKTAVVTGAASGIGRALTLLLSRCGATVHALDCDTEGLGNLTGAVEGPGVVHIADIDVRDHASMCAALGEVVRISKSIDFHFNNAGVTLLGEAQNIPFERWKWLLDINLMGVIHGTQAVYPIMIAQGSGHIINTSSIAGGTGYATAAAYTASKAAILELSRSMGAEAKIYGVKVSAVCPGYVDSGIFVADRIVGADREAMIRDLPVKMMTPDRAAFGFLVGVMKERPTIVFPASALLLWNLGRWAPCLTYPFHRRFLRIFREPRNS